MKYLIAVIAALVVVVGRVEAQQYSTTTSTLTNTIAALSTNTVNAGAFTATKYGEVTVTVQGALTAAGTTGTLFTFERGHNGTVYAGQTFPLTVTQAGTVTAYASTNISMGAFGYLRVRSIGNGDDDGVLTNVVVSYTVKPTRLDGQ